MKRRAFYLLLTLCAVAGNAYAQRGYTITDDKFSPSIKVEGPGVYTQIPAGLLHVAYQTVSLRSWIDKSTGQASHQIYITEHYEGSGWRTYSLAHDDKARAHEVVAIANNVSNCEVRGIFAGQCDYDETIGAEFADAQMREYAATGFDMKVEAKDGTSVIINISAKQIGSQLAVLNQHLTPSTTPYPVDPSLAPHVPVRKMGIETTPGKDSILIVHIDHASPLFLAGVRWPDGIITAEGVSITSEEDLQRIYDGTASGKSFDLVLSHNGAKKALVVQMP